MKKFLISAICLFSSCTLCFAQKAYERGQHSIQAGHGFFNMGKTWISSDKGDFDYEYKSTGALFVKYEYGIFKYVSVGLNFAYVNMSANYKTNSTPKAVYYKTTETVEKNFESMSFNLRHNFHFYSTKKADVYCGIGVGYREASFNKRSSLDNWTDPDRNSSFLTGENFNEIMSEAIIGYEITAGVRYLFTDHIGLYTEAGIAKSFFQFGAHIKF